MARCIISRYEEVPTPPSEGFQQIIVWANYSGSDWPGGSEINGVAITVDIDNDTPQIVENKALTAVRDYAAGRGVTIPANSIIYPGFKKG